MTSNDVEIVTWNKSPSLQESINLTPPQWSDFTSHKPSHFASLTQPSCAEKTPRSKLEIRTRDSDVTPPSPLSFQRPQITSSQSLPIAAPQPSVSSKTLPLPGTQAFSPTTSKKRDFGEIIDLTIEDDDFEPPKFIERKKSRSSSYSTEASIEARTTQPGLVKKASSKSVLRLKTSRTKEKNPHSHFSKPGLSFGKSIPAVIVPPPQPSPQERRRIFIENLSVLDNVSVVNTLDDTSPPLDFQFVVENVFRDGVQQVSEDFMIGCKCRKENGRHMGCEYLSCECLDELQNSEGKKQFPYSQAKFNTACLRDAFIKGRNHIFECNSRCNCDSNCKNRVVQHGRKVGLEIFKTTNRGWGLRCTQDLKKGQFIDTYRGEIISHDEANRRGETRTQDQEIYLMGLDKWTEENGGSQYVCDGMHLGGPTRFINHSCDPNCAIYTVSYNHADTNIYDLAFFATEPISAGTELTFNYMDDDKTYVITEEKADEMQRENGYRPTKCRCGSKHCRGYFFT
ncbi:MAG: hypothetical protein ASARMPRED_008612 [Alectoria sarmentosa]|nr:MAG: hypothetical protein ASARMPRED_008612 [Alectoria sarmentosa]